MKLGRLRHLRYSPMWRAGRRVHCLGREGSLSSQAQAHFASLIRIFAVSAPALAAVDSCQRARRESNQTASPKLGYDTCGE
jgi:hypothetical protein